MVEIIKENIKGKVVFLGVGNILREDDGVGCVFAERLNKALPNNFNQILVLNGGEAPENYLEVVVNAKADKIFIVDAVDFGGEPGDIKLFEKAQPQYGFSTHGLSLGFVLDYLKENTKAKVYIVGIQPEKVGWGEGLSYRVEKAVKDLVEDLLEYLKSKS